jgi:hypothetical protein
MVLWNTKNSVIRMGSGNEHGQAAAHGVEALLLVEPQHLLLQLLRLVLVLGLDLLQLRLDLHVLHLRAHGLGVERPQGDADEDAEEDEHPAVADTEQVVHAVERPLDGVAERPQDGSEGAPAERVHVLEVEADSAERCGSWGPM